MGMSSSDQTIFGMYQTESVSDGYAHVEIVSCEDKICGVIRRAFDPDGHEKTDDPNLNMQIISGMQFLGNGKYGGGTIYSPKLGRTFKAKMKMTSQGLKVSVFGMGQTWKRVESQEADPA